MNKIINFMRGTNSFLKKMELATKKMEKKAYEQLLESDIKFLNYFGIKTDDLTEEEIKQKAKELLESINNR